MDRTPQKFRDFKINLESFLTKGWKSNDKCLFLSCVRVAPEQGSAAIMKAFNNAPHSMQWGIYQDFFEICGIYPEVSDNNGHMKLEGVKRYHSVLMIRDGCYCPIDFVDDKEQARNQAISEAIKYYEETELLPYLTSK